MPKSHPRTVLLQKLNDQIQRSPVKDFPADFHKRLTQLHELNLNTNTPLNEALNPLLNRLAQLGIHLFDNKIISNQEKARIARNIMECAELIEAVINDPSQLPKLQKKLRSNAFELRAHPSAFKHYSLSAIDSVVNGVNAARGFVFKIPYPRCSLSTKDFIADELQRFTLHAEHSSTRRLLSSLRQQGTVTTPSLSADIMSLYHGAAFLLRNNKESLEELDRLIAALTAFEKQNKLIRNNEVLNASSEKAFWASQDLVIELLSEKKFSKKRIIKLTACLEQTVRVLETPGQKDEVHKLEQLIAKSDYKRLYSDKERTCYAIIHVLVSVALLGVALVEAIVFQSASLAASFWTIAAEVGSVGVGIGQLRYYADSEVKNTLFAESMGNMSKAARLRTNAKDWERVGDINSHRRDILAELQQKQFNTHSDLDNEIRALLNSMANLRNTITHQDTSIIHTQALAVVRHGEDLAIDIMRSKNPSSKRIHKLRECIEAANQIVLKPDNQKATRHLINLVRQGNYETRRIIKRDLFIGVLLALASAVLYAITITGTVFSAGATAGTILSPFMLSMMAANKLAHCRHREVTPFSDEAKTLVEFAQMADKEDNAYNAPSMINI